MRKSFTLIELIVVIAIISVLASIIAPNAFKAIEKAKVSQASADTKAFKSAAYAFYGDTGDWNTIDIAMYSLTKNDDGTGNPISGWDGPYLDKTINPADWLTWYKHPWGGVYFFQSHHVQNTGAGYEVGTPWKEVHIDMDDTCAIAGGCPVPQQSRQKMDEICDDGDTTSGLLLQCDTCGLGIDWTWVIVTDAIP